MTARIHRFLVLLSLLEAGLLGSSMASAHGGEDHGGEGNSPAPAMAIAPRAQAQSEDFEVVAVLDESPSQSSRLLITVDRFKTNEPVVGAKLEVDANGQNLPVQEQSPGVYVVQSPALNRLAAGAKLLLIVSVETDDISDLLTATLELSATVPSDIAHSHGWAEFAVWAAGAALALAAAVLLVVRRRHFTKRTSS